VSVGGGASGEYGDFKGKFDGTFTAEWNDKANEWEKDVQLRGSLGPKVTLDEFG
jgi:hypothetical protein